MFRIARIEGIGGLYQGVGASLCGIIPYAATDLGMFFTLKELVKTYPPPWEGDILVRASIIELPVHHRWYNQRYLYTD